MKKVVIFVFALSLVMYMSGLKAYGQGKGRGQGPPASHGQSQTSGSRHDERVEHSKTEKTGKDKDDNERREAKESRKDGNFEERIERNPALKAKVGSLLPAGTNLKTAASGFKNQGQFIAALHVSKNLDIPFSQLKGQMTVSNPMPLGEAIHKLRPNMPEKQAMEEAKRAEKQAKVTEKAKPIS